MVTKERIKKLYSDHGTLIIFLAAVVAFLPSLKNGFAFDDLIHVQENPSIRTWNAAFNLFIEPTYPGDLFRPLTNFSYALNYLLAGPGPLSFHVINILLHASLCALAFILIKKLLPTAVAFYACLLFALNPIHVEVVANIIGRAELLAAFFALIFLIISSEITIKRSSNPLLYLFSGLTLLAALLSKESALTVVALLILTSPKLLTREYLKTLFGLSASICSAVAIFLVMRWNALGVLWSGASQVTFSDNPLVVLTPLQRAANAMALLQQYFTLSLAPISNSADYSFAQIATSPGLVLSLTYIIPQSILFILALKFKNKLPGAFLGLAWFNIAFLITSNIFFPIGTIFAERLAYLPSLGVSIFLATSLLALSQYSSRINLLLIIIIPFFAIRCMSNSLIWRDNNSLWEYQITKSPNSAKTQANYSVVLRNAGKLDEALVHAKQASSIDPDSAQAAFVQGTIYKEKNIPSAASHWYREAIKLAPEHVDALNALGELMFNVGQIDESEKLFNRVLELKPEQPQALLGKATLLLSKGEKEKGCQTYSELLRISPEQPGLEKLKEFGC